MSNTAKIVAVAMIFSCCGIANADETFFSARASSGKAPVESPNGKLTVSLQSLDDNADDFPTRVTVTNGERTFTSKINFGLNAEVSWNARSSAFAVTGSSEGANGQYHTTVFVVQSKRLVPVPLTHLVESTFGHPVKCGWPEVPNVAAIRWLDDATLLVAAEIISHSNCDSFGTFQGFVVDVRVPRVIRKINQLAVKHLYGADLGPELKDANDECIRHPRACFVATNHPERKTLDGR